MIKKYIILAYILSGFLYFMPAEETNRQEKIFQMYQAYKAEKFQNAPDISVKHINRIPSDSLVFLDVRESKEYKISRIPNAVFLKEFNQNMHLYKNKKIIVYCTIGYRSGIFTGKLLKLNFDAVNLIGGVLSWAQEGRKFESPESDSLTVHVYGKKWNLLPENYNGVW